MDKKEKSIQDIEDNNSEQKERYIILEALKSKRQALPSPSAGTSSTGITSAPPDVSDNKDSSAELAFLKRIIGDFHPSPKSKTYKELYQETKKNEQDMTTLRGQLADAQKKADALKKEAELKESELIRLRSKKQALEEQEPELPIKRATSKKPPAKKADGKKLPSLFRRIFPPKKQEIPEERKKEALTALLIRSHSFSDGQFEYLANVLKKSTLPADGMACLFDARLTVERMRQVYSLACSKYSISENIGAGPEAEPSGSNAAAIEATTPTTDSDAADNNPSVPGGPDSEGNASPAIPEGDSSAAAQEQKAVPYDILPSPDSSDIQGKERLLALRRQYETLVKAR